MTAAAERFARAAEDLVGTPFRLYGRDPATGLDCVGLVVAALKAGGIPSPPVPAYALRNRSYTFVEEIAERAQLRSAGPDVLRGDVLMTSPGPAQRHLLIATGGDRFVHAHAGLRRVVCMPGSPSGPICNHWRLQKET